MDYTQIGSSLPSPDSPCINFFPIPHVAQISRPSHCSPEFGHIPFSMIGSCPDFLKCAEDTSLGTSSGTIITCGVLNN